MKIFGNLSYANIANENQMEKAKRAKALEKFYEEHPDLALENEIAEENEEIEKEELGIPSVETIIANSNPYLKSRNFSNLQNLDLMSYFQKSPVERMAICKDINDNNSYEDEGFIVYKHNEED